MIPLIICLAVLLDLAIMWAILMFVRVKWHRLADAFPAVGIRPGSVSKRYQSIRLDALSLGWCVHISADDQHLHLVPSVVMRPASRRTLSIPWHAIEHLASGRWSSRVRINGMTISGPRWCLDLAAQEASPDA